MLAWRKGGEVGDTFDSLIGFVDGRRGSHVTDATHGGYYGLMPHSSNGALCLSLLFATTPHNRLSRSAGFRLRGDHRSRLYKSEMIVKVKTPKTMQVQKAEVAQDKL